MELITHPIFLHHRTPDGAPENPDRLSKLVNAECTVGGFIQDIGQGAFHRWETYLAYGHSSGYIAEVRDTCGQTVSSVLAEQQPEVGISRHIAETHTPKYDMSEPIGGDSIDEELLASIPRADPFDDQIGTSIAALPSDQLGDTYVSPDSYTVAVVAAGMTVDAAVRAAEGESAFLAVRPPGHHAHRNKAGGFCIFNNVAIAARYLASQGKRVFIFDFDIHHGDGTENIVGYEEVSKDATGSDAEDARRWNRPNSNIHYFSIYQEGLFASDTGQSCNNVTRIELPDGTTDKDYIKVLEKILVPALEQFRPDIVLVSAGFDSSDADRAYTEEIYDRMGLDFHLTADTYRKIDEILRPYKRLFVLEGGYDPINLKECIDIFCD